MQFTPPVVWLEAEAPLVRRSRALCIVIFICTLGIYGLLWLYRAHRELPRRDGLDDRPLWAVLPLLVPVFNLYWGPRVFYRFSQRVNAQLGRSAVQADRVTPWAPGLALLLVCTGAGVVISVAMMAYWWLDAQGAMNKMFDSDQQRALADSNLPPYARA